MSHEQPPAPFLMTRHGYKPDAERAESEQYPGLAQDGLEAARERVRDLAVRIAALPRGTVVLLSGVSNFPRTRSTLTVYAEALRGALAEIGSDVRVITRDDSASVEHTRSHILAHVEQERGNTVAIAIPLFVKDFSPDNVFVGDDGDLLPEVLELLERYKNDESAALRAWLDGSTDLAAKLPKPRDVAERYLHGLGRLHAFAQKNLPDRPVVVGGVGHSWALDALAVYLAHAGKVDAEGFDALGGDMIEETELVELAEENGSAVLKYRGVAYRIDNGVPEVE